MSEKIFTAIATPEQRDVLDKLKKDTMRSINCCQIGTIQSFNAALNTATVAINFKVAFADERDLVDYPALVDVPVVVLSGGSSFVSLPIVSGDTCLVLFCDRDIDNWWFSGLTLPPNSTRIHSLSDGIAIVGVRPMTNPVVLEAGKASLNGGAVPAQIKGVGAYVDGTAGLVYIKNVADNLKSIMNDLLTAINALTVTTAGVVSGVPNNAASFTAIKARINLLLGS